MAKSNPRVRAWVVYSYAFVAAMTATLAYAFIANRDHTFEAGWFGGGCALCLVLALAALLYGFAEVDRRRAAKDAFAAWRRATNDVLAARRRAKADADAREEVRRQEQAENMELLRRFQTEPTAKLHRGALYHGAPLPRDDRSALERDWDSRTGDIKI